MRADDLNARFKELVGDDYTVKDLRTWHGTVLAAAAFADADPAVSQRVAKRVEAAVMREVAEELGNTPAVARGSYVDPRVVTGYDKGTPSPPRHVAPSAPVDPRPLRKSWKRPPAC